MVAIIRAIIIRAITLDRAMTWLVRVATRLLGLGLTRTWPRRRVIARLVHRVIIVVVVRQCLLHRFRTIVDVNSGATFDHVL